jgi:hypothetical protein
VTKVLRGVKSNYSDVYRSRMFFASNLVAHPQARGRQHIGQAID